MIKILTCSFYLLVAFSSFGQLISGSVTDATNEAPLVGALVMSGSDTTVTDEQGRFTVEGNGLISIQFTGYETFSLSTQNPNFIHASLTPSTITLGEVVVTSGVGGQTILQSPASINVINKKMVQRDDPFTLTNSINRVPGVYMHSGTYNTNRITIRGIGSRTLYGTNKVKAYFDEIPLTDGSGNSTIEDIDQELIERIEIIKGPNSSLYGAGLGGTIRMFSLKPTTLETSVESGLTLGSFGTKKIHASARHQDNNTDFTLTYTDLSSDGYRENSQFDRNQAGLSGKIRLSDKSTLSVLGVFTKLKAYIPSSINQDDFENDPKSAAFTWAQSKGYESYDKGLLGLTYSLHLPHSLDLKATVFGNYRDAYEPRPFDILDEKTQTLGTRAIIGKSWSKVQMNLGFELFSDWYQWKNFENEYDATTNGSVQGSQFTDNYEQRNYLNAFTDFSFDITNHLVITSGLNINYTQYEIDDRFNADTNISGDYDFDPIISPKVGLVYQYQRHAIFGNVSHGFSPPSLEETLYPSGQINPNIEPETGWNYEIGLRGSHQKWHYDITAYFMEIKNLLVAQRIDDDRYIGVNAGLNHHLGLDVIFNYELISKPGYKLNIFSSLSYMDFKFVDFTSSDQTFDGNQLTGVPKWMCNPGVELISSQGIYGNLNLQYVGEIPIDDANSQFSDEYSLLKSKIGYKWTSKHLSLDFHFGVNNITNTQYASMLLINATGFNGAQPRYYYPGNPINYYGGLKVGFRL
ncbi:MAG: TonB-dependent receptor [Marinoscillum sp.]